MRPRSMSRGRWRFGLMAAAMAALVLAGCGGGAAPAEQKPADSAPAAAKSAATTPAAPQPAATKPADTKPAAPKDLGTIKVGYTAVSAMFAPLFTAADSGAFQQHGLKVEPIGLESSSQLVAAIVSGSVQMSFGDSTAVAKAMAKDVDLVYLSSDLHTYVSEVWGKPEIKSVQDLKGKKFGNSSPGSLSDVSVRDWLKINGLDPDKDVQLISAGGTSARAAALKAGQVDAIVVSPPQGVTTQKAGAHRVDDLSNLPHMSSVLVAKRDWVEKNEETVRAFMQGYKEGLRISTQDRAKWEPIVAKYTRVEDKETMDYAWDYFKGIFKVPPSLDPKVLQYSIDQAEDAKAAGLKAEKVSLTKYIDEVKW